MMSLLAPLLSAGSEAARFRPRGLGLLAAQAWVAVLVVVALVVLAIWLANRRG